MLTDIGKEFDTPLEDENGELIEVIELEEAFTEEDIGLEEKDDSFYQGVENDLADEINEDLILEENVNENVEIFNNSKNTLIELYTKILEAGEITAEDNILIEEAKESFVTSYTTLKENVNKKTAKTLEERLDELKENFVGASADEILNILTENGTKCWLYKDDDDNVLIDGTSIPELTVLVNKFKMIATDGENEGEFTLNPDFIQMVVKDTGTGDAVKSIDNMYYLSTSKYELIGGTWVSILPTSQDQQGKFLWIKTVTTYIDTTKEPTETQPICVSSQDGENGADGVDGKDGVSVEEVVIEYAKNQYTTTAPTTGWSTSMPSYQKGYYLWYRTRIKYSNSSYYVYSTPVCDQSWKASQEVYTQYEQLKDKFSWIVKSGTSSSNMELTDKMYSLMTKKVLIEAKKIELNGSIDINNGTFKVATNGNTKIGGLCTHTNSDGTSRGVFEVTSEGTVYSRHKTNQNIYTMLKEGKITVKNDEGTLTFENGQIKVSDGSMATYYGDGYIGHNNSIMVETPRLTCTQKVTATEFTSSMDIVLRSEKSNTTNSDGSTNNDGGSVWLCCAGADVSKTDSRVIRFFKNSNGDYVFRSNSKAGVTYLGTATYPFGNVTAKKLTQTSDRTLKENIAYLSNAISTYNPSGEITIEDCYNFVSNDLPIATYNYVDDCDKKIGFIAQDLLYNKDETDNKIGQLIVNPKGYTEENGKLTYDLGNYVSVLAGALQVAIRKIENLEGTLNGSK